MSLDLAISERSDEEALFTLIVTSLEGELIISFEHDNVYLVVIPGVTERVPDGVRGTVALSELILSVITQLSAKVLVHERVDDCPEVIVTGEAVNVVMKGTGEDGGGIIVPRVIVTLRGVELRVPLEHTIL